MVCPGNGGGFALNSLAQATGTSNVTIEGCAFSGNLAALDGGGVYVLSPQATPDQASVSRPCSFQSAPLYRTWLRSNNITIVNCTFADNRSPCSICCGGAVASQGGAAFTFASSSVVGNSAGFSGGGISLGGSSAMDSCAAAMIGGLVVANNTAFANSSAQISNNCGGAVVFQDATVIMSNSDQEVSGASLPDALLGRCR